MSENTIPHDYDLICQQRDQFESELRAAEKQNRRWALDYAARSEEYEAKINQLESEIADKDLKAAFTQKNVIERHMDRMLEALSSVVCTPEKGYFEDGGLMQIASDTKSLAQKYKQLESDLGNYKLALKNEQQACHDRRKQVYELESELAEWKQTAERRQCEIERLMQPSVEGFNTVPQHPVEEGYEYHYKGTIQKDWEIEVDGVWMKTVVAGRRIGEIGTAKVYRSRKPEPQPEPPKESVDFQVGDVVVKVKNTNGWDKVKIGDSTRIEEVKESSYMDINGWWFDADDIRHATPVEKAEFERKEKLAEPTADETPVESTKSPILVWQCVVMLDLAGMKGGE